MNGPNVVGLAEAALQLGISRERIRQLKELGRLPTHRQLECGPIWDRAELEAFRQDRIADNRRVAGKHAMCLRLWRETHNVSSVARSCGIARATVRRWLEEMGEPVETLHDPHDDATGELPDDIPDHNEEA